MTIESCGEKAMFRGMTPQLEAARKEVEVRFHSQLYLFQSTALVLYRFLLHQIVAGAQSSGVALFYCSSSWDENGRSATPVFSITLLQLGTGSVPYRHWLRKYIWSTGMCSRMTAFGEIISIVFGILNRIIRPNQNDRDVTFLSSYHTQAQRGDFNQRFVVEQSLVIR